MELSTQQRVLCEKTGSFATLALAFTNFTKFPRAGISLSQTILFYWLHGTTCPGVGKEASHHALKIKWMIED